MILDNAHGFLQKVRQQEHDAARGSCRGIVAKSASKLEHGTMLKNNHGAESNVFIGLIEDATRHMRGQSDMVVWQ